MSNQSNNRGTAGHEGSRPYDGDATANADATGAPAQHGTRHTDWVNLTAPQSRRKRHRQRKRRKRIIIALVCVLAFALVTAGSAFAFTTLINQGRLNLLTLQDAQLETEQSAVAIDDGKTVTYKGKQYRLNENMVSLCLIGQDKDLHTPDTNFNGQADFVMVLAIDTATGKMTGIVVPRDSMVDVNVNYIGTDVLYKDEKLQLCLQYAYGTDDASSSKLVSQAVSRAMYNIPLDYYYTISMDGVYALTDEVDGVVVNPLQTIPNTNIVEGQEIKLQGDDAAKYVQWRDTSQLQTALDRQARQMQFMKALVQKALTVAQGSPANIVNMYNVMSGYATTNLTASEVSYLATVFVNGGGGFDTTSLKGESAFNDDSPWEQFILDKESVYQTVLDVYYTPVEG